MIITLRVEQIRIYPVKGFQGLSVPDAVVEPWGLADDRRWMVVDVEDRFLTQRQLPHMATLCARPVQGGLRLSSDGEGGPEVAIPPGGSGSVAVAIFDDVVPAVPVPGVANAWLSDRLGVACRLVYMAEPAAARPVDPGYGHALDRVSFADGFPLLVTTAASLADLNRRLAVPVPMDRFRTNLALEGAEPWEEDGWRRLRVGEAEFDVVKDCARCAVPTVDQATGSKSADNEPLRTLGTFRRKERGRIIFGQNLVPRKLGRVAVGDRVEVLA